MPALEQVAGEVGQTIGNFRTQQPRVCRQIHPETFFGGVVDDFVHEVRADERLAAGWSEHAARRRFEPFDGAPRGVFGHAFYAVVIRPAVVAVQIALPLGEEVGNDGLKVAGQDP